VLGIIALVVSYFLFGPKVKEYLETAQKDPTRALATLTVNVGGGQVEMVQEDQANKRYTVRDKKTGKLTTIYWNEKTHAPETVEGDFSAIPANAQTPGGATPEPATPEPVPATPEPATPEPAPATPAAPTEPK
jgi:hypothetical protein